MSVRALRTFLAAAKHGTFAAAAKEIGLTQAAISSQMRALESELKTALFDRTPRSVVLNTAGRNLIPRAAEIVSLYNDLAASVNAGELGGTLGLGAIPPTFSQMLPDTLLRLKKDHPGVQVRVVNGVSNELTIKVERGELDAALVTEPPVQLPKTLIWHPILREPLVLITPKSVKVDNLKDVLARHPFIRISRLAWTGRLIEQTLRRYNIKVTDIMELDSLDTIREMVGRRFGVSIIPLHEGRWREDTRLRVCPLDKPRIFRTIGLIERAAHSRTRLTAVLLDCLLDKTKHTVTRKGVRPVTLS